MLCMSPCCTSLKNGAPQGPAEDPKHPSLNSTPGCLKVIDMFRGARNFRPRLGCFGVSAVRARLALSIVHVSVRPPCHPGQSHLASPVGDHDFPSAIFPVLRRLKRSLAYPHATQVHCTGRWPCALPHISGTESGVGAHLPSVMTESPFAPSRRYLLGRHVPTS
jgi:hypothetical protein